MGATGYQEGGCPAWEPLAFPELLENRPRGGGGGLEEEVGFGPALMGGEGVGKPADGVLGGGPRGLGSDASRLAHTEGFSAQGQHFLG